MAKKSVDTIVLERIQKGINGLKAFFKKFGIWAVLALVVWLSPSWLSFFIPALKPFALTWLGLVVSPAVPSWAAVPLLAVILSLIYKGIVWLVRKIKDWIMKARYGAELVTLFTVNEVEVILKRGREMQKMKNKLKDEFNDRLAKERMELTTTHWEPNLKEAKKKR